jgi:hypothetical protein
VSLAAALLTSPLLIRMLWKLGSRNTSYSAHGRQVAVTDLDAHLVDAKAEQCQRVDRPRRQLTRTPLPQTNAYAMIGRRAAGAGIKTRVGKFTRVHLSRLSVSASAPDC